MKLIEFADQTQEQPVEANYSGYKDTAEIKSSVFHLLQRKIEKLNKKATKLGLPPITLTVMKTYTQPIEPDSNVREEYNTVKIEGKAPKVEGYKFLATIDHKDGGNVIRTVPGMEGNEQIKDFYDSRPDYCDHCRKVRHRIETFIIQDTQSDQLRQVGRNCLGDFLPGIDPKAILFYFSMRGLIQSAVDEADEEGRQKGIRGREYVGVQDVLTTAAALIRTYGYRRTTDQSGERVSDSTAAMVRTCLGGMRLRGTLTPTEREWLEAARNKTPADEQRGQAALEWFNSIPEQQRQSDNFLHNIDVIVKGANGVEPKDFGYVVAIFPAMERAQRTAPGQQAQSNEYVGQVGAKLPLTKVKVVRTHMLPNNFGYRAPPTQIVQMTDELGNMLVWFNSSGEHMENQKEYHIAGTIKKHEDFKGRKQTVLTRVKTY
jgi:hypothetical protein